MSIQAKQNLFLDIGEGIQPKPEKKAPQPIAKIQIEHAAIQPSTPEVTLGERVHAYLEEGDVFLGSQAKKVVGAPVSLKDNLKAAFRFQVSMAIMGAIPSLVSQVASAVLMWTVAEDSTDQIPVNLGVCPPEPMFNTGACGL